MFTLEEVAPYHETGQATLKFRLSDLPINLPHELHLVRGVDRCGKNGIYRPAA